jgi:hypothetical protein
MSDTNRNVKCPCGALSVEITGSPVVQLVCHCNDCREATQLPFINAAFFKGEDCITQGESNVLEMKGSSGFDKAYFGCAKCGAPLYAKVKALNGACAIVSNDQPDFGFEADAHIWTSEKVKDVEIPSNALQSESGPTGDIREHMVATFWAKQ